MTDISPEQTIRRMISYMPEFYKTHRQFENCTEFLANGEWGLALESLIELADETEHYFSEDFWKALIEASDKMKLEQSAKYCRQQILRNERDIKSKTPFGWTTVKIDDTHFQHHIAEKLKQNWETERRSKDRVTDLIKEDGVHLKSNGRSGYIYIVDKGRIAEVYYELGVNGLILYFQDTTTWTIPVKQELTLTEKQVIKNQIIQWADRTKNAIDLDE
jgi:hypothetical protein